MGEFELIRRYFEPLSHQGSGVLLGIGDDAALLQPMAGKSLAVSTDTLIAGRHFPLQTRARDVGWKALAVNLSDLAAMAATPRWFTLALTLPEVDERWLREFCEGLGALARSAGVALVGGDTTRGPLSMTLTVLGEVAVDGALRRSGARPGDQVCVTGTLGDAALALRLIEEGAEVDAWLQGRLNCPQPRLKEAHALRHLAHCAIDVSDGLAADLGHLLAASEVGAVIRVERLPRSPALMAHQHRRPCTALMLSGGDDYELCLSLAPEHFEAARAALALMGTPLTAIGAIRAEPGLVILGPFDRPVVLPSSGFQHFR